MAKTNKFNVPHGLVNQGKVDVIPLSFHKGQSIRCILPNNLSTLCFKTYKDFEARFLKKSYICNVLFCQILDISFY